MERLPLPRELDIQSVGDCAIRAFVDDFTERWDKVYFEIMNKYRELESE